MQQWIDSISSVSCWLSCLLFAVTPVCDCVTVHEHTICQYRESYNPILRGVMGSQDCPFCQIANNQTDTEILLSDDELVCFRDVKPGATHHYLIVSRKHIDNCKSLQGGDVPLVERMEKMGRSVLEKNKVSDLNDVSMGFHVPPFSSVPHLHLHALAPASKMNLKSQLRYGSQSHWFITVEKVLAQLRTRGKVK